MKATFTTAVKQEEGMNATGLQVPAEIITALNSSKRPKVKVSLNGYTYRSTVAAYGDVFMHKRIHSSLGYLTPVEFEAQWYADQKKVAAIT